MTDIITPLIRCVVPGKPIPQPRGKPVRRGNHVAMVSAYQGHPVWEWRDRIKHEITKSIEEACHDGYHPAHKGEPVHVSLRFRLPFTGTPRKTKPNPPAWHTKRPDVDNLVKPVIDAISETGLVWKDDSQVCSLSVEKSICSPDSHEQPQTEVLISACGPYDEIPF